MTDRLAPLFTWRAAITESGLPPTTRHVLLTLSLHMSERGENAFPSVETLAHETGLSKRCVITQLQKGEDEGWIRKTVFGYTDRKWKRHRYIPMIPEAVKQVHHDNQGGGEAGSPPEEDKAVNDVHYQTREAVNVVPRGGEPDDNEVVNDVHPNSSVNSPDNSSGFSGAGAPAKKPGFESPEGVDPADWQNFVAYREAHGSPLTAESAKAAAAVLLEIDPASRRTAINTTIASGGRYLVPLPSMFHAKPVSPDGMPRDNVELAAWAKRHGLPEARRGESFPDYRRRLAEIRQAQRERGAA